MTWSWSVPIFFIYWVLCCSYFVLVFLLKLQYLSKFCSSVVEITPHLPDKLSIHIYLSITLHLYNLDKKFFVLRSALIVLILPLFSSKFHCYFKIVLIKKSVYTVFSSLSFINICVFFSYSILWPIFTRLFRDHFIPFLSLKQGTN